MDGENEKVECDEQVCPLPPIQTLPLLVLAKIFKFLSTHDRQSAMQVCQRWHNIINLEVGLTVFVGKRQKYSIPGHKCVQWKPLHTLTCMGVDKCFFAELADSTTATCDYGDGDDQDKHHSVQGFMVPELVKELYFYGKITNKLFRVILTPVYWLTTLKIHLSVFRLVSFENYTLRLYSLSHLGIFYTHPLILTSLPFIEDDPSAKASIHGNLVKFLSTCFFRRIKIFGFVGPYFVDEAKSLVNSIKAFVARHQISLKKLFLSFPYEWNMEEKDKNRNTIEVSSNRLESLSSLLKNDDENLQATKEYRHNDWGTVQLHCLQVVCPTTVIVPPVYANEITADQQAVSFWYQRQLNECWRTLLEKQLNLTSLHYVNKYEDWTFPQAIFLQNADTLKTITLCVNSNFHVDCKFLSCCTNLRKLSLEGNFFHYENHDALDNNDNNNRDENNNNVQPILPQQLLENGKMEGFTRLFNAHHLPESLQEICLSKLLIPVAEVETIVDGTAEPSRFPNLKSLQLYQISKGYPQFGLTTTAVQHLFNRDMSISFWQALNCTSFENVISKAFKNVPDREVMTLMKILEFCDEEGIYGPNLRFETVHDCHVQLIRAE